MNVLAGDRRGDYNISIFYINVDKKINFKKYFYVLP